MEDDALSYEDGDCADYDIKAVRAMLIDEDDALEEANLSLLKPERLVGARFKREFGPKHYLGTIISHDEDENTEDVIWRVE